MFRRSVWKPFVLVQVKYPRASCVDCENLRSTYWWLVIQNDPFAIGASIQIEVIMDIWKDCKRHANYTSIQKCYSNCPVSMFLFSSVCLSVRLSISLYVRPAACPFILLSVRPSVSQCAVLNVVCSCLSACLPAPAGCLTYLFACLSVCSSVCLPLLTDN